MSEIKTLKEVSRKAIKRFMDTLHDLENDEDSDVLEEFMYDNKALTEEMADDEILDVLKEVALEMVDDPEKILAEADLFSEYLERGDVDNIPEGKCPFMLSLWNGDLYDLTETDALNEMIRILTELSEDISDTMLMERTRERIEKK